MAKVLISMYTNLPGPEIRVAPYFEGLIRSLVRAGNTVNLILTNHIFNCYYKNNELQSMIDPEKLNKYIEDYNPDLVIAFNHSIYDNLYQHVDCPIVIWMVDSPSYMIDPQKCKQRKNEYRILTSAKKLVPVFCNTLDFPKSRVDYVPCATDFVAEQLPFKQNISFIGSNFGCAPDLEDIYRNNLHNREFIHNLQQLVLSYSDETASYQDISYEERLEKLNLGILKEKNIIQPYVLNAISTSHRIRILDAVSDLGLSFYGTQNWQYLTGTFLNTALCFNPDFLYTIQHNQDLYNSSKININISHIHAAGGLPFRICDIMASQGALVSDHYPLEDIEELFGDYVKIPVFTNAFDARKLCQKILNDEAWRQEIIMQSQAAIKAKAQFSDRIKQLGELYGVDLTPEISRTRQVENQASFYQSIALDFNIVSKPMEADEKTQSETNNFLVLSPLSLMNKCNKLYYTIQSNFFSLIIKCIPKPLFLVIFTLAKKFKLTNNPLLISKCVERKQAIFNPNKKKNKLMLFPVFLNIKAMLKKISRQ